MFKAEPRLRFCFKSMTNNRLPIVIIKMHTGFRAGFSPNKDTMCSKLLYGYFMCSVHGIYCRISGRCQFYCFLFV